MGNVYMEASQINYRGGEKKMSVEEALKNTSGESAAIAQLQTDVANLRDVKANQITIAPAFSAETSYDPGDLVYYNGLSYRCVNAHEGEWDADDFAATTISNELASLMSGLTVDTLLSPTIATETATNHQLDGNIRNYKLLLVTLGADAHRTQASNVIVLANTNQYYNVSYQSIDTRFTFDTTTSITIDGQWYVAVYGVLK